MTQTEIILLSIIILIVIIATGFLIYKLRAKKKQQDDLFIIVQDEPQRQPYPKDYRKIIVPSGQKYKSNIYPDDRILLKKGSIIVTSPIRRAKVIECTNPSDEVAFTIKKGTQQPITRV